MEGGRFSGLVVLHKHVSWAPVLVEVLLVAFISEGLEERLFSIVEVDLEVAILRLIDPGDLPGVARSRVDRILLHDKHFLTVQLFFADELETLMWYEALDKLIVSFVSS